MSDACCNVPPPPTGVSYRRVLWIALFANVAMFLVELGLFPWLAILVSIPIAYCVGFALSRVLRSSGAI